METNEIKKVILLFSKDEAGNTSIVHAFAERDVCEVFKEYYEAVYPELVFQIVEKDLIEKKNILNNNYYNRIIQNQK